MITLITGVPGGGKTLLSVQEILRLQGEGRAVYSDIAGIAIAGVLPAPDDWRDTPEGSVVVYDEAQKKYPSTGQPGVAQDERIRALETHRHTGHDIFFITQEPSLIHHHIRKLVGRHMHVHRAAGLKRATLFTWDFAVAAPNDRKEQQRADVQNWNYPKKLFSLYKSATVHTHKFHVPKKIAAILAVLVLVVGFVGYRLVSTGGLGVMNLADAEAAETPGEVAGAGEGRKAPAPPGVSFSSNAWASAPPVPAVIGCVGTETTCRCFGADGLQLDLELAQCLNVLTKPLPTNVLAFSKAGTGGAGGAPPAVTPLTSNPPGQKGAGGPVGVMTEPSSVGPPGNASGDVW